MKKKIREVLSKYRQNNGYTMEHAERELLDLFSVMCYAGDEVRENGTDIWYKVKRVDGRYETITVGSEKLCWYCGVELCSANSTKDHFFPKSKGGRLQVHCCNNCNKMKGDMSPIEFVEHIKSLKKKHLKNAPWQKKFNRMINATIALWDEIPINIYEIY